MHLLEVLFKLLIFHGTSKANLKELMNLLCESIWSFQGEENMKMLFADIAHSLKSSLDADLSSLKMVVCFLMSLAL